MRELPMAPLVPIEPMQGDEREMARGVSACHNQIISLATHVHEAAVTVSAMFNALAARGLISEDEVAEFRGPIGERISAMFSEQRIGVQVYNGVPDKYALSPDELPEIDCEKRYHLCHAACCALRFPLSTQDLEEGVVRWELGEPYRNRVGPDGHCVHIDRGNHRCSIYARRPAVCRVFDCRNDSRIWWNFDTMEINPNLYTKGKDGRYRFRFVPRDAQSPQASDGEALPSARGAEA